MTLFLDSPNVLLIGDFNTEPNVIENSSYEQIIHSSTTSGIFGGQLCHAYCKMNDYLPSSAVLFKCFTRSQHHPIVVMLENKHTNH